MKLKDIKEVEMCFHCNDSFGYYTRSYVTGWIQDNTLFELDFNGERQKYNHQMYDSLNYGKRHKTCYCMNCNKPIGIDKSE